MLLTCKLAELLFNRYLERKKSVFPLSHSTDIGEFSPSQIGQWGNVKLRYTLTHVWRSTLPDRICQYHVTVVNVYLLNFSLISRILCTSHVMGGVGFGFLGFSVYS